MKLNWHKSSYSSQQGGNCVEVAEMPGAVYVRDTQNRDLGHVGFTAAEWAAFLGDVKTEAL